MKTVTNSFLEFVILTWYQNLLLSVHSFSELTFFSFFRFSNLFQLNESFFYSMSTWFFFRGKKPPLRDRPQNIGISKIPFISWVGRGGGVSLSERNKFSLFFFFFLFSQSWNDRSSISLFIQNLLLSINHDQSVESQKKISFWVSCFVEFWNHKNQIYLKRSRLCQVENLKFFSKNNQYLRTFTNNPVMFSPKSIIFFQSKEERRRI